MKVMTEAEARARVEALRELPENAHRSAMLALYRSRGRVPHVLPLALDALRPRPARAPLWYGRQQSLAPRVPLQEMPRPSTCAPRALFSGTPAVPHPKPFAPIRSRARLGAPKEGRPMPTVTRSLIEQVVNAVRQTPAGRTTLDTDQKLADALRPILQPVEAARAQAVLRLQVLAGMVLTDHPRVRDTAEAVRVVYGDMPYGVCLHGQPLYPASCPDCDRS